MHIAEATVQKVISTADILDVVSDYVNLKRFGTNHRGLCPFHNEKSPSFSVSPSKNICKCFSCGKGGNPVHFIMELEGITFPEAIKFLAKKYNIEVKERELTDEEKKKQGVRESLLVLNTYAQKYFSQMLFEESEGINVGLSYFRERGFNPETVRKFQLGYSLDSRNHLSVKAQKDGYNKDLLIKTGLAGEDQTGKLYDKFRGRVIFPIHSISGSVRGFGGRILGNNTKAAKYLNSSDSEIYHKREELYGIFFAKEAIKKNDCCYIVEGYTDVISMHQAGVENVVAPCGTAITDGQIRLIGRHTKNFILLLDGDKAGINAALKIINPILEQGINLKCVLLPEGEDPDSFARKHSASEFQRYIDAKAVNFIDFKTGFLLNEARTDSLKMAELINSIAESIAVIPDLVLKSVYIQEAGQKTGIGADTIAKAVEHTIKLKEIEKAKKERYSSYQKGGLGQTPATATRQPQASTQKRPTYGKQQQPSFEGYQQPPFGGYQQDDFNTQQQPPFGTTAQQHTNQAAPQQAVAENKGSALDRFEYAIITYIIKYGERKLGSSDDNQDCTVMQYIKAELEEDEIEFKNPIYSKVLYLAKSLNDDTPFESYFINHYDTEISTLAVDVAVEEYHLSKIHTKYATVETEVDKLVELIPRAVFELKDAMIRIEIQHLNEKLKDHTSKDDPNELISIMEQIRERNELRIVLARELGDRIITPFIR